MLVPRTEHIAARPSWNCMICARPWPCLTAKKALREQYVWPTGLGLFMASCLYEAIESYSATRQPVPTDLYERFLGWIATPGPTPQP